MYSFYVISSLHRSAKIDLLLREANSTFEQGVTSNPNDYYIYIYSGILAAFILTSYAATALMAVHSFLASKSLHNRALTSILGAPMSFFNSKPIGMCEVIQIMYWELQYVYAY